VAYFTSSHTVLVLSERGHFVLKGKLHCRLASLLDGRYTTDDIVEKVAGEITPAAEVYYALELLEKKGYITEADSTISPDRAAFWHVLGLEPHLAESRMKETTVSVTKFGTVPIRPFASALVALNIQTGEDSEFAVVLTDD
jgi:oxazoline/thiazoline synthase